MLRVENLSISVGTPVGRKQLLHDISFTAGSGELTVILGESGSGKTTLLRALTSLFPEGSDFLHDGKVLLGDTDLLSLNTADMAGMRKSRIRYIFQEPSQAFNPVLRVQTQLRLLNEPGESAAGSVADLLHELGITDPARITRSYPHQLSVGTLQRIQIALALAGSTELLICDEPTSAADPGSRRNILELLSGKARARGATVVLSTHDLNIAREYGNSVIVLYGGMIVEQATAENLFKNPVHPYSRKLVNSGPRPGPIKI